MNAQRYFGRFEDGVQAVNREFQIPAEEELKDREVLFAAYEYANYTGDATVLFRRGKKLFEVGGSHCSCNGLERQWHPGEVTWKALAMRDLSPNGFGRRFGKDAAEVLQNLVQRHTKRREV